MEIELDQAEVKRRSREASNVWWEALGAVVGDVAVTAITYEKWSLLHILGAIAVVSALSFLLTRQLLIWWAKFHTVPLEMYRELAEKGAWPEPYRPIPIVGKKFRNEKVVLDGHSYSDCDFENVTLVYNGTTPIYFGRNAYTQPILYEIGSRPGFQVAALLFGTGALVRSITIDGGPNAHLGPPIDTRPSGPNSGGPPPTESAS